jgi:putative PIN family toxin of toxin-antitoxin system
MKVFVDTNILVSAILFPKSKVAEAFSIILKEHSLVICQYSIEELEEVFRIKFPDKIESINIFMNELTYELIDIPKKIDYSKYPNIRDKNDLPILVSAILSKSDILLTGDKDFEDIEIKKPVIMKPMDYISRYKNIR